MVHMLDFSVVATKAVTRPTTVEVIDKNLTTIQYVQHSLCTLIGKYTAQGLLYAGIWSSLMYAMNMYKIFIGMFIPLDT